jgi:hypothetical protein
MQLLTTLVALDLISDIENDGARERGSRPELFRSVCTFVAALAATLSLLAPFFAMPSREETEVCLALSLEKPDDRLTGDR